MESMSSRRQITPVKRYDSIGSAPVCEPRVELLAAPGEGTILAGRRGPLRQW